MNDIDISANNTQPDTSHQTSRRPLPAWFIALALGLLAMIPRCMSLDDFFTVDESFHWVWRVMHFMNALDKQRWENTNLTGHPGVTTLWLGSLGRTLAFHVGLQGPEWYKGGVAYLALLRLPLAMVNSIAVAAGYLVLRRLLHRDTALLAGLLWALSPFMIAHSRLLHMDALLTSFMTLSLLYALAATTAPNNAENRTGAPAWLLLIASGICGGLALLTKAPSLILLPAIGLVLFFTPARDTIPHSGGYLNRKERKERKDQAAGQLDVHNVHGLGIIPRVGYAVVRYSLWLACAALVAWAAWPALWVNPGAAIGHVIEEIVANGGQPHASGNYFLGQPVADPGALFYLVVVVWRTSPVTLVGLLLLPWVLRKQGNERAVLLALLGFILLFGTAMTLQPKKFDRYLLPIWPALTMLAAAGITGAFALVQNRRTQQADTQAITPSSDKEVDSRKGAKTQRPDKGADSLYTCSHVFGITRANSDTPRKVSPLAQTMHRIPLLPMLILLVMVPINLWYHPYYLAYFNPLVGGGSTGPALLLTGWGEGMEQVGVWLRARPDVRHSPIISWDHRNLEPFVPVRVVELDELSITQPASYAVLYVRGMQRGTNAEAQAYVRQTPPLYTLTKYGIEYAKVYQPIRPFDTATDALFGEGILLRGFRQDYEHGILTITPSWSILTDQPGGLFCFVHVLAPDGQRIAQVDAPLDEGLFSHWQAGQQFGSPLPLALPPDVPPGTYRVGVGVYTVENWARQPLTRGEALPADVDGDNVLLLTTVTVGD